jgi:ADP-heptose:LPS heptosyltransferase
VVVARSRPPSGERRHVADHLLATLAPLGPVPARPPAVRLVPPTPDQAWAAGWLAEHGLPPAGPVLVHAGAGSVAKAWPGFPDLVRRLTDDGAGVVVSVGPGDGGPTGPAAPGRLAVARDVTLGRLAALAARAGAFVGNDSGPTHLAALVGCPTVAVFGPTDPARWAPRGPHVQVVGGDGGWPGLDRVAEAVAPGPRGRGGAELPAPAAEVA